MIVYDKQSGANKGGAKGKAAGGPSDKAS